MSVHKVRVIDSHTGGEPTRVVIDGGPRLTGPITERLRQFRQQHDAFRAAVVNEPRGSDVLVGALLMEPEDPANAAAVIFFNNVGFLGMCGHGTIGLVTTLAWLGRLAHGEHRIETPVGLVRTRLLHDGRVAVRNVPAYRHLKDVTVQVEGHGSVRGDVAWGGNWFFLVSDHGQHLELEDAQALLDLTRRIGQALERAGIRGADGGIIDHVELFGSPHRAEADSRNFVLCPGGSYDRSPCGTGTSAKLACLHADEKLAPGEIWVQESITDSIFEGSIELEGDKVIPTIAGHAWVTADATLLLDSQDPCCWGIGSAVSAPRESGTGRTTRSSATRR
ncbi:MAG TPA: proline racemase family protein [Steroidobacteraceae bacterium]|nr:proline racemase family protein [Steroidobacteraceae bacterium]